MMLYNGLGSGPLPRLAPFPVGYNAPDHPVEVIRALLVKRLSKRDQPLVMEKQKELLRLPLLCKLFRDSTINIISLPGNCI